MAVQKLKQGASKITKEVTEVTLDMADLVEKEVEKATKEADTYISPLRKSALKRYPVLFSLLVTFGVVTTLLGFEQVLLQYDILRQHPWFILFLGVTILLLTGTLYKNMSKYDK
ncbi:MAG: hypothetical protein R3B60_03900 [Candidatus Paceibacterota bacterium]